MSEASVLKNPSNKDLYDQTESLRQEIVQQVESVQAESAQQVFQAESEHRINLVLERIGVNEEATKAAIDRKFNFYAVGAVFIFFVLLSVGAINYLGILNPRAGQTLFVLGDPLVTGSTSLCPGESLDFSVSVDVVEKGTYVLDMSTWQVQPPPATVILSEGQRMVVGSNRSFPIARKWIVPKTYVDLATNEEIAWKPGDYSRDISVTAGGKNVESSTKSIPFTIREDCAAPKK